MRFYFVQKVTGKVDVDDKVAGKIEAETYEQFGVQLLSDLWDEATEEFKSQLLPDLVDEEFLLIPIALEGDHSHVTVEESLPRVKA